MDDIIHVPFTVVSSVVDISLGTFSHDLPWLLAHSAGNYSMLAVIVSDYLFPLPNPRVTFRPFYLAAQRYLRYLTAVELRF